jgi:hypothetical protein
LVGYILEGTVDSCVDGINSLLKKDGRASEILTTQPSNVSIDNRFSKHSEKEIFHLFLNYT